MGRLRPFDVGSSGRSTGLWHRQASSGCFRDLDPANGRRPTSAVPRKPVGGDAIFRLPVRPVVAGGGCCGRRNRRHFADVQGPSLTDRYGAGSSESRPSSAGQSAVGHGRPRAGGSTYSLRSSCADDPKKASARIGRYFLRLHAHILIAKIPRSRRWHVSNFGRNAMCTLMYLREHHFRNAYASVVH